MRTPACGPRFIFTLLLCCGVWGGSHAAGTNAAPPHSAYWRERVSLFQAFSPDADIAMVGDSLTDGAEWADIFPGRRIVNRGIDSDTTRGVLDRVDTILSTHPRRIFVMLGINDFADEHRSVEAVFQDYRQLVARLQEGGSAVVIESTLPCNVAKGAWKACARVNPKILALNARLPQLATGPVRFVSLSALSAPDGSLRDDLTFDGVHLNGRGYQLWRDAIAPLLP